ncbi:MAG: hypothetical protein GQ565_02895 [Candidatus Aegiribacteria sp.]|nr:hypothetical protein [Candidatus Aegiribacteria sp.]
MGGMPPTPTPDPEPKDLEADGEPTPDPEPEPDSEPESKDGEADPEPTQDPEPEGGEADKPALLDSHYRAALRMGMTSEDVSELYDAAPEVAQKALAKCFEMVNASSRQLGELGRVAQRAQAPEPAPAPTPVQPDASIDTLIGKVREHYGADDPMTDVLSMLLRDRQPAPQAQPEPVAQRSVDEEIAARQQIGTFFAAEDMTAYDDLYGANDSVLGDWSHLTPGQRENRKEVCNRAQMLLYGATAAGMEMGTAEALERAHLEVSAPMAEQIVRSRLIKSVKQRERGVTLEPNGSNPPAQSGGKYDKTEAVESLAAEMRKVFG